MCEIHMKHTLLVVLSIPDMKKCFNSQDNSFSTTFSEKRYDFEYLKPKRFSFMADVILSLELARTILDVTSMSMSSFAFNKWHTYPKISTITWIASRILVLRRGMWFNPKVIASFKPWLWIIFVSMVRTCIIGSSLVLSIVSGLKIVSFSKNCYKYICLSHPWVIPLWNLWKLKQACSKIWRY